MTNYDTVYNNTKYGGWFTTNRKHLETKFTQQKQN